MSSIPTMTDDHVQAIRASSILASAMPVTEELIREVEALVRSIVSRDSVVVPRKAINDSRNAVDGAVSILTHAANPILGATGENLRGVLASMDGWLTPDTSKESKPK
jgi:hypothetical protein